MADRRCRRPTTAARRLAALALAGAGCTYFQGDARVLVTSTPPGARILVDGEDSGRTTPSMVDLGGILGSDHELRIEKRGFDPETRRVYHFTRAYTARWIDGAVELTLWPFPFFWPLGDWVLPAGVRWIYVPHEVHVRLYPEGEAPVHDTEPPADAGSES